MRACENKNASSGNLANLPDDRPRNKKIIAQTCIETASRWRYSNPNMAACAVAYENTTISSIETKQTA